MDSYQRNFIEWMKTERVGCAFARRFARLEDVGGLQGVTVHGNDLGEREIMPLNVLIAGACANSEGVYVIFPEINSPDEITRLVRGLCGTRVWECVDLTGDIAAETTAIVIGLRWHLPDGKHMNYVLGFANIDEMPRTRRAPNTTLVLRTGPPGRAPGVAFAHKVNPKKDERSAETLAVPVHLADMPDLLPTEEAIATVWRQTMKLKAAQLVNDTMASAARAKVTFCLPAAARRSLADVIAR